MENFKTQAHFYFENFNHTYKVSAKQNFKLCWMRTQPNSPARKSNSRVFSSHTVLLTGILSYNAIGRANKSLYEFSPGS